LTYIIYISADIEYIDNRTELRWSATPRVRNHGCSKVGIQIKTLAMPAKWSLRSAWLHSSSCIWVNSILYIFQQTLSTSTTELNSGEVLHPELETIRDDTHAFSLPLMHGLCNDKSLYMQVSNAYKVERLEGQIKVFWSKKTKGPTHNSQYKLRSPIPEGREL
jgi:hypothetical protein